MSFVDFCKETRLSVKLPFQYNITDELSYISAINDVTCGRDEDIYTIIGYSKFCDAAREGVVKSKFCGTAREGVVKCIKRLKETSYNIVCEYNTYT
jgi:lipocalin